MGRKSIVSIGMMRWKNVLKESSVLTEDGLGAMGVIRIQEVLKEPTGLRFYGWEARAGVGVVLSDFNGKSGDPLASVEFDWSRPSSINLQFNDNFYANTVFNKDSTGMYNIGNSFQVYYEMSNRIHWDNTLKAELRLRGAENSHDSNSLNFSSTFLILSRK